MARKKLTVRRKGYHRKDGTYARPMTHTKKAKKKQNDRNLIIRKSVSPTKKISKRDIEEYVRVKYPNTKLISVDFGKGEFVCQYNNGSKLKGFINNVEEWKKNLASPIKGRGTGYTSIQGEKYKIADWFLQKNQLDLHILIGEGDGDLKIKRETDKALLLTNNNGMDFWIPKSALTKIKTKKPERRPNSTKQSDRQIGTQTARGRSHDEKLVAKYPGSRTSKSGKKYYERRINRSDKDQKKRV